MPIFSSWILLFLKICLTLGPSLTQMSIPQSQTLHHSWAPLMASKNALLWDRLSQQPLLSLPPMSVVAPLSVSVTQREIVAARMATLASLVPTLMQTILLFQVRLLPKSIISLLRLGVRLLMMFCLTWHSWLALLKSSLSPLPTQLSPFSRILLTPTVPLLLERKPCRSSLICLQLPNDRTLLNL